MCNLVEDEAGGGSWTCGLLGCHAGGLVFSIVYPLTPSCCWCIMMQNRIRAQRCLYRTSLRFSRSLSTSPSACAGDWSTMSDFTGASLSASDCETVSTSPSRCASPAQSENMFLSAATMSQPNGRPVFSVRYAQPAHSTGYWFEDGSAVIEVSSIWYFNNE